MNILLIYSSRPNSSSSPQSQLAVPPGHTVLLLNQRAFGLWNVQKIIGHFISHYNTTVGSVSYYKTDGSVPWV